MKSVLLDTNSYSKLIRGDRKIVKYIIDTDVVYLSVIVIGELFGGFEKGTRRNKNMNDLKEFLSKPNSKTVSVNQKTAQIYGKIRANLSKKGTPIPTNDIWIAAHVFETGSILITYDKHFLDIPDLKVWDELLK